MHPIRCCNCGRPTFSRIILITGMSQLPICRLCDAKLSADGLIQPAELKNARVFVETMVDYEPPRRRLNPVLFPLSRLAALFLLFSFTLG